MPYVTSLERMTLKKGREEGIKKGREEGIRDAVRIGVEVRFGAEGLALMDEIEAIQDEAVLIRIQEALVRGLELEAIRALWQR